MTSQSIHPLIIKELTAKFFFIRKMVKKVTIDKKNAKYKYKYEFYYDSI